VPSTFGAPNFAVSAFKAAIDVLTSVLATPRLGVRMMKHASVKTQAMRLFLYM
jgi:hypothetical protein